MTRGLKVASVWAIALLWMWPILPAMAKHQHEPTHNPCMTKHQHEHSSNPCMAKHRHEHTRNPCNPCNPCRLWNPCNPCNPCSISKSQAAARKLLKKYEKQIMNTSGGEMDFNETKRGQEKTAAFIGGGANPITDPSRNPLITEHTVIAALTDRIAALGEEEVEHHLRELESERWTVYQWYHHTLQCPICGPIFVYLTEYHQKLVSQYPHELILFGHDQQQIDSRYYEPLERLIQSLKHGDMLGYKVLLIGRASRRGGDESYNLELSKQRAWSVENYLRNKGITSDRIARITLGYEPPQIDQELMALYRLPPVPDDFLRKSRGRLENREREALNRSTLVIAYDPADLGS